MQEEDGKLRLKKNLIKHLRLKRITPEMIDDEAPLFKDGLGLDSIAAIEVVVMLEKEYGIKIKDPKMEKEALANINTLYDFILSHK